MNYGIITLDTLSVHHHYIYIQRIMEMNIDTFHFTESQFSTNEKYVSQIAKDII